MREKNEIERGEVGEVYKDYNRLLRFERSGGQRTQW